MMSRAEVRRSLLAIGVHPRVVDTILERLPEESHPRRTGRPARQRDAADLAAARVLEDFERLLDDEG